MLACNLLATSAWSAGKDDHERVRRAVESGQVLALPTVLERLSREHPGQVLDVDLEQDGDHLVYEIKLLKSDGQLVHLKLDARTGTDRSQPSEDRSRSGREQAR